MDQSVGFVCIGAGNVASHLAACLSKSGYPLMQVFSRTERSAKKLASRFHSTYTISITEIRTDADFYLVSVPDQALPDILDQIQVHHKLILHTSGSHGLEVFGDKFQHFGVLYPLQTFSRNIKIKLNDTPFLIEAGEIKSLQQIEIIARSISEKVYRTDSETRRWIHLAAVFACNFTNHMLAASSEILKNKNLDPDILKPLIKETFRKSMTVDPVEAQTGPAVRNDNVILEKHFKMLNDQPLLQKIYTFTSQSIQHIKTSGK